MHILELCSGWCSVSRVFKQDHGWHVTTLDNQNRFKPTILTDIATWDYWDYFATHPLPDVIWASPPCRTMTVAAWARHRGENGEAISREGKDGDACVQACLTIIQHCLTLNPRLIFFCENPLHGAFRRLPSVLPYIARGQYRALQYGDYSPETHSLKPTIVLTNCDLWTPRPIQRRKSVKHWNCLSKKQRTILPRILCEEIAGACVESLGRVPTVRCTRPVSSTVP